MTPGTAGRRKEAVRALQSGTPVVVLDDDDREAEADLVLPACSATGRQLAFMIRHTSGLVCAPMPAAWAERLDLPPMVEDNRDPHGTAYTVSVDSVDTGTGISAVDRSLTLRTLADRDAAPDALRRPGHVFPLRGARGGIEQRRGHTEAAICLLNLAGLPPVAAISELVHDDGTMLRGEHAFAFALEHALVSITVGDLASSSPRVSLVAEVEFPNHLGRSKLRCYRDLATGADHLVEVVEPVRARCPLVRVHSECLTGDVLGSMRCDCGGQLLLARRRVHDVGGAVIYLRGHEGRGIGLAAKLRAYELQDRGADTVEANLRLGYPVDARDFKVVSAILDDLGYSGVTLLTNNQEKLAALRSAGRRVEREALVVPAGLTNGRYLATKRDRMGHLLPGDLTPTCPKALVEDGHE